MGEQSLNSQQLVSKVQQTGRLKFHLKKISYLEWTWCDVTDVRFVSIRVTLRSPSGSAWIMWVSRHRVKWIVRVAPQEHKIAAVERVQGQPLSVCVFLVWPWQQPSTFSVVAGEQIAGMYIHYSEGQLLSALKGFMKTMTDELLLLNRFTHT